MKRIFIFLDDERELPHFWSIRLKKWNVDYIIFRDYSSICEWLQNKPKDLKVFISFDHDLGFGPTGYDVAKFIVENNICINGFTTHSMNPVGAKNIIELLEHYGYYKMKFSKDIIEI